MKYKIGETVFEAENLHMAILHVKANSLTGTMREASPDAEITEPTPAKDDRKVTVTCVTWQKQDGKWSRSTHKWSGTIAEVSGQSCCPQHRK